MWSLFVICFGTILIYFYAKRRKFLKKFKFIPSPPSLPLIGHLHLLMKIDVLLKIIENYKGKCLLWIGIKPYIIVYNAEDMEVILRNSKEDIPKGNTYEYVRPWLGDSILISHGPKFQENKKILVRTFHKINLLEFIPVFNANAKDIVDKFKKHADLGEFRADKYLAVGTMFNLLAATLGIHKGLLSEEDALNYCESVEKLGAYIFERHVKFWLSNDFIFQFTKLKKKQDHHLNILNTISDRVLKKKKIEYEKRIQSGIVSDENSVVFLDNFFSATKSNGENYSSKEIKDEVMTMMFAGQETSTVTLGFTLSLLGIYQDVQEKVYAELMEIFGESDRDVTYEDTKNLKYLEQVIQESWRLYPPINAFSRSPIRDIKLGDYILPKGSTIVCALYLLHRNENYFPNGNKFDPGNFHPERVKARPGYSFIPFSQGYRKCIGSKYAMLVAKVFLATILRKFKVTCHQKQEDFKLKLQLTSHKIGGFKMSVENRF
ncbi:cytochrome P450 4g1 [Aethina tumida]|uniref:cytochrome P450 4g1 n=1 Tax=Aethina tumida TaxID=116153 RepID=UPI002149012B|nr:cytochrome P450 4g1 [Aethina tumida]